MSKIVSLKPKSLVVLANEKVSIFTVCRLIGMDIGDDISVGRSTGKLYCPFGEIYHDDGGVTRTFRIYPDTNSAHCFRCSMSFTSVNLASRFWGRAQKEVASELLNSIGYKTLSVFDRWNEAVHYAKPVDVRMLGEALQVYCEWISADWDLQQFDSNVSFKLSQCFDLLAKVTTAEAADLWLEKSKIVMSRVLISVYG